jgi:uncharacterized membrane protein YgaE (UPF0421/DUF939 family)
MKKIGMRNIKTAIAVLLCIIIINLTQISDSPLQACVATIISMQGSVFESFTIGAHRLIGTAIGALIAFLFALIAPESLILITIGIILTIYICDILDYNQSIVIACIIFTSIMFGGAGDHPLAFSIYRLIETAIGIIVALLVNYFISPPKHIKHFNEIKEAIVIIIENLINDENIDKCEIDLSDLHAQVSSFRDLHSLYDKEIHPQKRNAKKNKELSTALKLINLAYGNLLMLEFLYSDKKSLTTNAYKEYYYLPELDITLAKVYHIKTIKDILENLKSINL